MQKLYPLPIFLSPDIPPMSSPIMGTVSVVPGRQYHDGTYISWMDRVGRTLVTIINAMVIIMDFKSQYNLMS